MGQAAYCGIDVGTQGVRACLLSADGDLLGQGSAALPPSTRVDGRHEQDPQSWWDALVVATRSATAAAGADVTVEAVALDATSGTVLVEDADGRASGPALMYDDARAVGDVGRVQEAGAALWAVLGYRMQPTWALPKVAWLCATGAAGAGQHVVHQSDHLNRRLTGEPVATDTSSALKTGADQRTATWPTDVFAALDIPASTLPDLGWPGAVLGTVSSAAAAASGLPMGAVVRAGMTDGCAAQIAAGALRSGRWSSALGTTLVLKGSTERPVHDSAGSVYSHRHPDGGWLPGGASSTGAGVFNILFPDGDLQRLTEQAATRAPYAGVAYPLAGRGERFPFASPAATAFWDPEPADDVERFAAACQGIAFIERLAYDVLTTLGADTSGTVALTGGTARNDWWNQLRTDVLGRRTVVPRSAEAASGMAVLAMAEPGRLTQTAERVVREAHSYEPDPERSAELRDGYHRTVSALADRGWLGAELADAVLSVGARR